MKGATMDLNISSTRLANNDVENEEELDRCERCGELVSSTYTVITDYYTWRGRTQQWCEGCVEDDAVECENCGDLYDRRYISDYRTWDGDYIYLCEDCRCDNYYYCEDCGDIVHRDEVCWGSDDEPYCPDCVDRHRHGENVIGYEHTSGETFWFDDESRRMAWELSREDREVMFLGIELETDSNESVNDLADKLIANYGYERLVCKEDGSLSYRGLEIVSQPMTPLYHLNSGLWEGVLAAVREQGGKSHDAGNCGLHIHVSRRFFRDHDAVYRLDRLFHRFKNELINFSRRTYFGYCHLDDDDLHDIKDVAERKAKWADKKRYEGRYVAINDENSNTVEFRLWRGTLNDETFRATVELTAGLAIVANSMSDELADSLTWPMLKLLVRYALDANGIPRNDLDCYMSRRSL